MATSSSNPIPKAGFAADGTSSKGPVGTAPSILKSDPGHGRSLHQKAVPERPVSAGKHTMFRGAETNHFKVKEEHGKLAVKCAFGDTRSSSNASFPQHIKKKMSDVEKERQRGYQPPGACRVTSPSRQNTGTCRVLSPNRQSSGTFRVESPTRQGTIYVSSHPVTQKSTKLNRSASAHYENKFVTSTSQGAIHKSSKTNGDIDKETTFSKITPKTTVKEVQETRSSNVVTFSKRGSPARSKTTSPRSRRPFSIAADSTSDTDPVETQRSVEFIGPTPPRFARTREFRRQQYLATKFKLAVKNSKQTQTLLLENHVLPESKESSTIVLFRRHSENNTDITEIKLPEITSSQPFCQTENIISPKEPDTQRQPGEESQPITPPQSVSKEETQASDDPERVSENPEWKRAKARLRSTARSPSPPPPEEKHYVLSTERSPAIERSPFVARDRTVGAHASARPSSAGVLPTTVHEKQVTDSFTQMDRILSKNATVQVNMTEKGSPQRHNENQKYSQRRAVSAGVLRSENVPKEETKKKSKKKENTSGELSARSERSIRSLLSGSAGNRWQKERRPPSKTTYAGGRRRASSESAFSENHREKKAKMKTKESQTKIARFLRILSEDKEAIKSISKMADKTKKRLK